MMKRAGRGGGKTVMWFAIVGMIALVALAGWQAGWADKLKPASIATTDGTSGQTTGTGQPQTFVQPSLTVTPHDQYNGSTLGGTLTLFIAGVKSSGTAGTSFNAPASASVEAIWDDGQHY